MDIGAKVRSLRNKSNLSARKLGSLVDLDQTMIYKIERNEANPSIESLTRICAAFGVTMAEFFSDDVKSQAEIYTFNRLIDEVNSRNLPENEKRLVIDFITERRNALIPALIQKTSVIDNVIQISLINDIQELIEKYKNLSPKQQEALKMIIDAFSSSRQQKPE
ncbi:MAG: putative prophage repressor [Firmicutes bacterium]|nr:putative prophage repressor [Bacillota bacterium]